MEHKGDRNIHGNFEDFGDFIFIYVFIGGILIDIGLGILQGRAEEFEE